MNEPIFLANQEGYYWVYGKNNIHISRSRWYINGQPNSGLAGAYRRIRELTAENPIYPRPTTPDTAHVLITDTGEAYIYDERGVYCGCITIPS